MPDPLIVDTELQAEVIRQFNLRGELSPFLLTNRVVPIFDIGRLASIDVPQVVTTLEGSTGVRVGTVAENTALPVIDPPWDDADVSNSGAVVNPAAAAVIVDTGPLAASNTRLHAVINWNAAILDFQIEWRNAANAANIAVWGFQLGTGLPSVQFGPFVFNVSTNERFRVVTASGGTGTADATVMERNVNSALADQ